jgi:hypothetical protein
VNKAQTSLRNYLYQRVIAQWSQQGCSSRTPYVSVEDYVLDRGRLFHSQSLTSREIGVVLEAARRAGKNFPQGYCFANAAKLVVSDTTGELHYVEGFAVGTLMPVHHAWVVIQNKIVDLTWRSRDQDVTVMKHPYTENILGVMPADRAYLGVSFLHDDVLRRLANTSLSAVSFFDDWEKNRSLFRPDRLRDPPSLQKEL